MKEKVNNLLKAFGLKAIEIQLAQMVLADGVTTIEAEVFEAGQPVSIVTEGGTVALPVGEYALEDGRMLIVSEEGIIGEIKDAEQEQPEVEIEVEAPAAQPEMEMEQTAAPKKTVESVVKETYFAEMEALKAENEELKQKIQELSAVKEVELSEEPAATPIVHNPESEMKTEVFNWAKENPSSIKSSVLNFLNK